MLINADAYVDALTPPELQLGGKVYRAKLLSAPEIAPMLDKFQSGVGVGDVEQYLTNCREFFTACGLPGDEIVDNLPLEVLGRVVSDFFDSMSASMEAANPANRPTAAPVPDSAD